MPLDQQRVRDVLLRASELPAPDRPAFLDAACGGDADLRAEVESLLRALDRDQSFLGGAPVDGGTAAAPPSAAAAGSAVGPFRLIERLGQGGMGVVYLAEQDRPVRRRVALKMIRPGLDAEAVIARFEAERQALARMDHTNIARIYDAGTTPAGLPYFVMELVDGVPITTYCDANRLPAAERLALFVPVCRAVQHAHQKGIVHRDLKPGNVLVTVQDGRPLAKVIDFGIAKAIDAGGGDGRDDGGGGGGQTLFTRAGLAVGTPEYMSPEQAGGVPGDLDTRTDVYALGVILYELLTGRTPLDRAALRRAGHEAMARLIRDVDPPRPSTRLLSTGGGGDGDASPTAAEAAVLRRTDPRRLAKLLAGELDCVVMKCLEKDRARRYDSANDLARDVERFLDGQPVEAGPPSRLYAVRRSLWRHRRALAVAASFAVLLAAALAAATVVFYVGRARATAERDRAVRFERQAEAARAAESVAAARAERGRYVASIAAADGAVATGNLASADDFLNAAPATGRNWEWNYLYAACNRQRVTFHFRQYTGSVRFVDHEAAVAAVLSAHGRPDVWPCSVHFYDPADGHESRLAITFGSGPEEPSDVSADGRRVLSVLHDRAAWLVHAPGRADLRVPFPTGSHPYSWAFGPDGTRFVATFMDGAVGVWDADTGDRLASLRGYGAQLSGAAFSRDGKWLVTDDRTGVSRVWDWAAGTCRSEHVNGGDGWHGSAFSPDGRRVVSATAASYRQGSIWDADTGLELVVLAGDHADPNMGAAFSPDGRRVAVCGGRFANTFDATTGVQLATFAGHKGRVPGVLFSADSARLMTIANDNTARIWDVDNPPAPTVLGPFPSGVASAEVTADGTVVVVTARDGTARAYDRADGRLRFEAAPAATAGRPVEPARFDPAAPHVAVPDGSGTVSVLDVRTGAVVARVGLPLPLRTAVVTALTHDGRRLVTGNNWGQTTVWDLATGKGVAVLSVVGTGVAGLSLGPADDRLIVRDDDGAYHLWDLTANRRLAPLRTGNDRPCSAEFSRDGRRIVTGGPGAHATLWDGRTGAMLGDVPVLHFAVRSASFNGDGTRVVVARRDGFADVWDVAGPRSALVTREPTLVGHTGGVVDARYTPDGTRILTTSLDRTARVWDADTFEELLALRGHAGPVTAVRFSRDGSAVLTVSDDGTVRVWDAARRDKGD